MYRHFEDESAIYKLFLDFSLYPGHPRIASKKRKDSMEKKREREEGRDRAREKETARQSQILISSLTKRERLRGERLLSLLGSFRTTVFHPSGSLYRQLEDSGVRRRLTSFLGGGKVGWPEGGRQRGRGQTYSCVVILLSHRCDVARNGTERSGAATPRVSLRHRRYKIFTATRCS